MWVGQTQQGEGQEGYWFVWERDECGAWAGLSVLSTLQALCWLV